MSDQDFVCYAPKNFSEEHLKLIGYANQIIESYAERGFSLTVRQLYYQFVSKDVFANDDKNYKMLASVLSQGRLAGLVSWHAIEDRTRGLRGRSYFESPKEALEAVRENYRLDKWTDQEFRPEVWIEKDALVGVIEPVCTELGINHFSCRGYNSQSEQWRAGRRFAGYVSKGQKPIVFHLGDHDPSGLDMTRDNRDRLSMFAGVPVLVVRLALNKDQIDKYAPPPNPAKMKDVRSPGYVREFGHHCWELDALTPEVIGEVITKNVLMVRDERKWDAMLAEEAADKDKLDRIIEELGG